MIGENVCGIDPGLELDKNGKVTKSPEMERRVKLYKEWQEGLGDLIVQMNVEDQRLGVDKYVVEKLGVKTIELKWGQRKSGGLEEAVLDRIRSHTLEDRCLISSFNPFCIRTTQDHAPDIPTAHIYSRQSNTPLLLRHGMGRLIIPTPFVKPQSAQVHLFSSFLARRVLNSQILTWTVDKPEEAARLVHLGVRGIISNHPGKIKAALPEITP